MAKSPSSTSGAGAVIRCLTSPLLILAATGCSSSLPARLAAPALDPEAVATAIVARVDRDASGGLSPAEVATLPSLAAAADAVDADRDGSLTRSEVAAWLKTLRDSRVALTPLFATVSRGGSPLVGAVVRLEPEEFMGGTMQPAEGTTDTHGNAVMAIPGAAKPGVNLGLYRVVITSPTTAVPASFNTRTTLGAAVGLMLPADGVLSLRLDEVP
jgi:hypothetical protein